MSKNEISKIEAEEEKAKAEGLLSEEQKLAKEEALKIAKKLEKEDIPTKKDMAEELNKFSKESEQAKKLLTPWYVKKKKK
jgi:hypothetical protein